MKDPAKDALCRERCGNLLANLADGVALHARERPAAVALVEHDTGEADSRKAFDRVAKTDYLAVRARAGEIVARLEAFGKWGS